MFIYLILDWEKVLIYDWLSPEFVCTRYWSYCYC